MVHLKKNKNYQGLDSTAWTHYPILQLQPSGALNPDRVISRSTPVEKIARPEYLLSAVAM
ncbi:MAG: hypothetical protein ABIK28_01450 [Planctomycetota bacterium]